MRIEVSAFTANEVAYCITLDMLLRMVHYQYMHTIVWCYACNRPTIRYEPIVVFDFTGHCICYSFVGGAGMCSCDDRLIISIIFLAKHNFMYL